MYPVKQLLKSVLPANTGLFVVTIQAVRATGLVSAWRRTRQNASKVLRLGSEYGGWVIPAGLIDERSVCYCAGCGEDITFDLALIERFNCAVYGIDPTPRAVEFVKEAAAGQPRYHLLPVGLWSANETVRFYAPQDDSHVSHSITNLQKTNEYFEAEVKTVQQVMTEHHHQTLTLLKLDIEGAELEVIESVLAQDSRSEQKPTILCVEFDCLTDSSPAVRQRLRQLIVQIVADGYELFWIEGRNFTFLRSATDG